MDRELSPIEQKILDLFMAGIDAIAHNINLGPAFALLFREVAERTNGIVSRLFSEAADQIAKLDAKELWSLARGPVKNLLAALIDHIDRSDDRVVEEMLREAE